MKILEKDKIKTKKITASLLERKKVADDTTELELAFDGIFNFKAGQYIELTIPEQNLEDNIREFSIVSSPNEKNIIKVSFRNSDSAYKKKILSLPTGSKLEIYGPLGVFVLPEDNHRELVMISGGIGVTPNISMIRYAVEEKLHNKIKLVYSNTDAKRAAYLKELKKLSKDNPNFELIENYGPVKKQLVEQVKNRVSLSALWYTSGTPDMVEAIRKIWRELSIKEENIRFEGYMGYKVGWERRKFLKLGQAELFEEKSSRPETEDAKSLAETLLKTLDKAALVAVTNVRGDILYVNQLFIDISKYSKEELIGQNHRILKSGYHPDEYYRELWNTISNRKVWRGEIKNKAKDGSFYWVDTSIAPILDKDGNINQYVAVRFPITEKKELEQEAMEYRDDLEKKVEERTNRLNLATQSAKIGVWDWNVVKNELVWDDQMYKLYGIKREYFSGAYEAWQKGVHPNDLERSDREVQAALKGDKEFNTSFRVVWPDESVHYIKAFAVVKRDKSGKPLKMTGVNWDITYEKEVDRAKTEFVSLASHQLRTPLTSIKWYAEMLLSGDAGKLTDNQQQFIDEIYQGNKRMVDLVNALLNVSRIELGTFSVEPKSINITEIANSILEELKSQIQEKQMNVTIRYDKNIPIIKSDPQLTRIIFQNLLSNAVKYTPAKGKITLSIIKDKKDLLIKVTDNGYGIPRSQQAKIFSKLFRADNIQKKDVEGNGLGLYIVKSIIEHSGGKIWFESKENKGTTFFVTLPLKGMKKRKGTKGLN